jgi:hypothetical protein
MAVTDKFHFVAAVMVCVCVCVLYVLYAEQYVIPISNCVLNQITELGRKLVYRRNVLQRTKVKTLQLNLEEQSYVELSTTVASRARVESRQTVDEG